MVSNFGGFVNCTFSLDTMLHNKKVFSVYMPTCMCAGLCEYVWRQRTTLSGVHLFQRQIPSLALNSLSRLDGWPASLGNHLCLLLKSGNTSLSVCCYFGFVCLFLQGFRDQFQVSEHCRHLTDPRALLFYFRIKLNFILQALIKCDDIVIQINISQRCVP